MEMRPNANVTDKTQHKLCNTDCTCTNISERWVNERQQSNETHL